MKPLETAAGHEPLVVVGRWLVEVWRGEKGSYDRPPDESAWYKNLIVTTGRGYIARRIAGGDNQSPSTGSAMAYMIVGTGTTAAALTDGSTPGLYGEIKRKALSTNTAGPTAANVYTAVMTLGGAADTVQSIAITEGGIANHAGSGQGNLMQRVVFASVTLADSDLFKLTLETNVGSS